MISAMRIGVHWDTEVARSRSKSSKEEGSIPHRVCQCFCSAVPVAYAKGTNSKDWAPLATAVLSSAYEATLSVATILARQRQSRVKVFLTSVGGGAFGNRSTWIVHALTRALQAHAAEPLDVYLVHYMTVVKGDFCALDKQFKKAPKLDAKK